MKLKHNWEIIESGKIKLSNGEIIETSTSNIMGLYMDGDIVSILYEKGNHFTLKVFRFFNLFDSSITIHTRLWSHKSPNEIAKELDKKLCS